MSSVTVARRLVLSGLVLIVATSAASERAPRALDAGDACYDGLSHDVTVATTVTANVWDRALECTVAPSPNPARATDPRSAWRCTADSTIDVCSPAPDWHAGLVPSALGAADSDTVRLVVETLTRTARGRAAFGSALRRSGRYRRAVVAALGTHHLPSDLEAVVLVESAYLPRATSVAGARGLWQLMPETARNLGLRVDGAVDERRSVRHSSDAAAEHLADLYATFGNWELALAAYNFGSGRVLERMRRTGAMSFVGLAAESGALPRETRDYVPQVLAVSLVLRNLDHFGFAASDRDRERASSELDVPGGTSLAIVARAAATSVRALRELNPALDGLDGAPLDAATFAIEVPAGALGRARAMLPTLLAAPDAAAFAHVRDDFDWGTEGDVRAAVVAALATPIERERLEAVPREEGALLVGLDSVAWHGATSGGGALDDASGSLSLIAALARAGASRD
jgi:hypothetical protein